MTFKLVLLLAMLKNIAAQCGQGCLQCGLTVGQQTVCKTCDTLNLYYLENGACVQSADPNCLEIDSSGVCTKCADKFYPGPALAGVVAQNNATANGFGESTDSNQAIRVTCQPVPRILSTANCVSYAPGMVCASCDTGFILTPDKMCAPVDIQTPNCIEYNSNQLCLNCFDGFFLSSDQTKCLPLPATAQCLAYSNKSCKSCAPGYYMTSSNNQLLNQVRLSNSTQALQRVIGNVFSKSYQQIFYSQCIPNDLVGCLAQTDSSNCATCKSGYYLDKSNQCQLNPYGAIANCSVYNNRPDSCFSCGNNFMRLGTTDPYTCTAVVPIAQCTTYSGSASTTTCTQCQTGYYVSSNACLARKYNTVSNCSVYNPLADSCMTCSSNYQLISNSTGNLCVALGSNCTALETTAGSYCTTCTAGFMPASGSTSCIAGSITNCTVYASANSSTYTTACANCAAGYALVSNACVALPKTFANGTTITNVNCNTGELPMMVSQYCSTNPIPYCLTYANGSTTTCSQCMSGYALTRNGSASIVSPNVCQAMASTLNCLLWDETNNICSQCASGYLLYTNTGATPPWYSCVQTWAYASSNCATLNTIPTDNTVNPFIFPNPTAGNQTQVNQSYQPCLQCAAGYLPIQQRYSCITLPTVTTQTSLINKNDFTLVPNCSVYNQVSNSSTTWNCAQCQSGYYLLMDAFAYTTQACKPFSGFYTDSK